MTTPIKPVDSPHGYKSWSRKRKILTWTGGTLGALFLVGTVSQAVNPAKPAPAAPAAQSASAKPAPVVTHTVTAAPKPAVTVTHTAAPAPTTPAAAAPAAAAAAPAAPAAPPADQIIARFNGTGTGNTGTFTVPADGNWHLSWAYTNGQLFAGQAENFMVTEYTSDGSPDSGGVTVNSLAIGDGSPTASPVYSDPAAGQQVHFQVISEDASWSLVAVTGTS